MDNQLVKLEHLEGVTIVILNRPDALNALSTQLSNQISRTFDQLKKDEQTEVIILTGAGRSFSVGLDLKELGGEKSREESATTKDLETALSEVINRS